MRFLALLMVLGWGPLLEAALIEERFDADPALGGWEEFGNGELFRWSPGTGSLMVTWDSSEPNSYFHRSLGNVLAETDDFELGFDIRLQDIAIGSTPDRPFTFEIAVGLINLKEASREEFYRGSGINADHGPRDAVEFDYFPDSGFGATFAPTVISTNNRIMFSDNHPLEMTLGDWFRIDLRYTSSDRTLRTEVKRNGVAYGMAPDNSLRELVLTGFPGFRVDTVAVMSYSDEGQVPAALSGSVLAHGEIDNLTVRMPPEPISLVAGRVEGGRWRVGFQSRAGWVYSLERTRDFQAWTMLVQASGDGEEMVLEDEWSGEGSCFYRVGAWKP